MYTEEAYRIAVRADYLIHATALTTVDITAAYGVSRGSVTAWAAKGYVRKAGKADDGRALYDVGDVLTRRDLTNGRSPVASAVEQCLQTPA